MLPTIGGWSSIQTKILNLQEASETIGNQFVDFWTQRAVVPVEVKQAQPLVDRGDGVVENPVEMTQEHRRDAEKAGHSERPVGGRQEGGSEGPSQTPGEIFPGVQLAMPQTPRISSLQNVSDSLTQNACMWRGAFVQPATGSAPTIAVDIKEPEAPIAPRIEVSVPRAPYSWYPGVMGKEKKRQYNPGSPRWLDASWGGVQCIHVHVYLCACGAIYTCVFVGARACLFQMSNIPTPIHNSTCTCTHAQGSIRQPQMADMSRC